MSSFFSNIPEPKIQEFYDLWCAKKQAGKPPYRREFPLQDLPHSMWQHLFFYNLTDDNRFFCIHNGTAVVRYFGNESTGHYMDDHISEAFANSVRPLYEGAITSGQGVYYRGDLPCSEDRFHVYSRLLLPLRAEDGANRHIIGIMVATGEERLFNREPDIQRRDIAWEDASRAMAD